jgi:predicted Zn-dependent protease
VRSRSLCLLLVASCAWSCATTTAPISRPTPALSSEQEAQIGSQADAAIRGEIGLLLGDVALQRDVQQIGARLAAASSGPSRPWHFAVLEIAAPNAFSLPGGYVYLTRGLLPYLSSHAELAAVIAHQIAHVIRGDAASDDLVDPGNLPVDLGVFGTAARLFSPGAAPAATRALFASHAPDAERQANTIAAGLIARAGFDPASLNVVLETLDRLALETDERGVPTWGTTHGRDIRLEIAASSIFAPPAADDFREHVHNLLFGDDPREGLVRANEFLKPNLRVALQVQMEWNVSSDRTRMIATAPDHDAFLLLQLVRAARGRPVTDVAATVLARAGFRRPAGETTTINDLPAFVGSATGTVRDLGDVRVRVACVRSGRNVFLLAGLAATARYPEVDGQITAAIRSFRAMTFDEASRILPQWIDLEVAKAGDTWDTIARRHGGVVMANLLAILNHAGVEEPPPAAVQLKVVVAGEK